MFRSFVLYAQDPTAQDRIATNMGGNFFNSSRNFLEYTLSNKAM